MKKVFVLMLACIALSGNAQNFSQSFDSVSTLSSYINFSLTSNRLFNGIGPALSSGNGASIVSVSSSNKLQFTRTSGSASNYFTRKYLNYNYPQAPAYGALLAKLNNPSVNKPKVAKNFGIIHLREGMTLTIPNSYSEPMYDSGYKIWMNVNYTTDTVAAEFPDSSVFRSMLINALNTSGIKPALLVIENEEPNKNYHIRNAVKYINELTAGVNVAHSYGFKATNGGITAEVLRYLTYHDYLDRNKADSAAAFYSRTAADSGFDTHYKAAFLQQAGVFCDSLLNAYDDIPMDYVNFHWYGGDEGGSESDIMRQCINFLERKTGKKAITNEIGQYDTSAAVVNDLLGETFQHQMPIVSWYDGDGTQAIALNNNTGVLRPNGVAFRNFLASHQLSYKAPDFVSISFKVLGSANTTINSTGNNIMLGNGFSVGTGTDSDDSVHSRINIAFTNNNPGSQRFKIGDGNGNVYPSTTGYNNEKQITWIVNNTGTSQNYLAPDGSTESVANDTWDLWVGTAKAFDNHAAYKTAPQLNDIKFVYNQGDGNIQFDDINIQRPTPPGGGALPMKYASFQGQYVQPSVLLQWNTLSTSTEKNDSHFDILRASDGNAYSLIGSVNAAGETAQNKYQFNDLQAAPGINYYRLEQKDKDGKSISSQTIAVLKPAASLSGLNVFPQKESGIINVQYTAKTAAQAAVYITDMNGRRQQLTPVTVQAGENFYRLNTNLTPGVYLLSISDGGQVNSKKFAW